MLLQSWQRPQSPSDRVSPPPPPTRDTPAELAEPEWQSFSATPSDKRYSCRVGKRLKSWRTLRHPLRSQRFHLRRQGEAKASPTSRCFICLRSRASRETRTLHTSTSVEIRPCEIRTQKQSNFSFFSWLVWIQELPRQSAAPWNSIFWAVNSNSPNHY